MSKFKVTKAFEATRTHHLQEAAEDYTELIADLNAENGSARVGEVAARLGITHVTALRTLRRLRRDGYVQDSKHSPLVLTPKGRRLAAVSKRRHEILLEFFSFIGVRASIAATDVEGIEHHISKQTLKAMQAHMKCRSKSAS